MKNFKHPATFIAFIALFVALTGGAVAAKLITGKQIKNNSVTGKDIKNGSLRGKDLKKGTVSEKRLSKGVRSKLNRAGTNGTNGSNGTNGTNGAPGSNNVAYQNPNWGTIFRNTVGSPDIDLAGGPNTRTSKPPFGVGSLAFQVATGEKAAFGNEVDFAGRSFNGLNQLGFHVFTTGEDNARANPNMPTIQIEIDPNLDPNTSPSNFATVTFQPPNSTANQWSGYINAATAPANTSGTGFFIGNSVGTAINCTQADPCTLTELKAALNDGGDAALVGSVSVVKGVNTEWQGAIDGLRVGGLGNGDQTFDFEPFGTNVRAS